LIFLLCLNGSREVATRFRTWPVAALGLGSLLLLVVVSVLAASNRAKEIYGQLEQLALHHRTVDAKFRRLRSDVHLSGIFMRDYLLDSERAHAPEYRQRLSEFRRNNLATLAELRALTGGNTLHEDRMRSLHAKLDEYWRAFEPVFDWTPAEKISRSAAFLRREVLPRREAVLTIASEIEGLNDAHLAAQRAEVSHRHAVFRSDLDKLLWRSLLLGLAVAMVSVFRLRVLERRFEEQRAVSENAERRMRQLSQQLVAAQEEERRKLSRELHDHVGQTLTALRMELGRIDRLSAASDGPVALALAESRQLVDTMVRTVRDLALGLRPSMLDDFGLQPALEWHVRDFTRRYGVEVALCVNGDFDQLSEQHRTCVYRVVQEALTNCIRHAHADRIDVSVGRDGAQLDLSISDNGIGFDPDERGGFGLRGIEERVRELNGTMSIRSAAGAGTSVSITLMLPPVTEEADLARIAG